VSHRPLPATATLHALLRPYSGKIVQYGVVAWWGAVDHYLGLAAGVLGRRRDAETALRAGLRLHEAWGAAPQIAASLKALAALRQLQDTDGPHGSSPSADVLAALTGREHDVLRLLATGAANKQIARELHISVHTVERHVANLYTKIGVSNRAAATVVALRHG
jgi:DNA-binding NarL/FixJ family response regulator